MFEVTPHILVCLKNMVSKIPDDMPTFRGIPIIEFEKSDLVNICKLFANDMFKYQKKYFNASDNSFKQYMQGVSDVTT